MSGDENDLTFELRTFNPVDVFEQIVFDLMTIVDTFNTGDSGIDPATFLKAAKNAQDRLEAIATVTVTGMLSMVSDKIPHEVRSEFEAQVRLDEMMETPEEKQRKLVKLLKEMTQRRQ